MKKSLKMLASLACAAAAMLLGTVAIYAADECIWLEAENGHVVCGNYSVVSRTEASGGAGMQLLLLNDEIPSQVDFTFEVPETGSYDIKILTSPGDVGHLSNFMWRVDSERFIYCGTQKGEIVYRQGEGGF